VHLTIPIDLQEQSVEEEEVVSAAADEHRGKASILAHPAVEIGRNRSVSVGMVGDVGSVLDQMTKEAETHSWNDLPWVAELRGARRRRSMRCSFPRPLNQAFRARGINPARDQRGCSPPLETPFNCARRKQREIFRLNRFCSRMIVWYLTAETFATLGVLFSRR
jgi:hypothetical protein